MKNKVMLIIFLLSLILLVLGIFVGIKIGSFQILSVSELKEKSQSLDNKLEKVSELTSIEYPKTIDTLEETYEKYNIQKQKYEELSGFTEDNKDEIYETKQYDIGYLWKIIGKYATSYNIQIGMDVKSENVSNLYNLQFNISGQYVNISEFIKELENNSDLSFRIYNFKMSGNSETVNASFLIKNVSIDPSTITINTTSVDTSSLTENSNDE